MAPRILAIGGGGFLMEDAPSPIDRYIVELSGYSKPRICFIGTPSGDPPEMIEKFYATFEALGCECSHLAFFRKPFRSSLPLSGYTAALLDQHAIFVGGGNTKSALAVWREWKLDEALRRVWSNGVLLSGMSAGALCWFANGLTDSYWGAGLKPLPGLGFLANGCCVHYNGDPERRATLHRAISAGALGATLAIDDGAAVLFAERDIARVVSWRTGSTAYQVTRAGDDVDEVALEAEAIA
jgi:dipeptidase E